MSTDEPIPWEHGCHRDLEAVIGRRHALAPGWHVSETVGKVSGHAFLVRTDAGVNRFVHGLTAETARTLPHEMAMAVRLRDG
jgi:hypothetical protein